MLNQYVEVVIEWVKLHPNWAGIVTFLVAYSETIVIIGNIIPGSVTMTAIGGLIGLGAIPFWSTICWAILGAILGDATSFYIGYHYNTHLREMWPFSKMPNLMRRGEIFFAEHGGKSIFLGRFVGPVRAFVPVIAGMLQLSPPRYIVANIVSACAWAPAYLLPGYLIGSISKTLPTEQALQLIAIILAILLLSWCCTWFLKQFFCWCHNKFYQLFYRINQSIIQRPRLSALQKILADPHAENDNPRQLATLLTALVSISIFAAITYSVSHHGVITQYNEAAWHLLKSLRTSPAQIVFICFTNLGDKHVMALTVTGGLAWAIIRKQWIFAIHLVALIGLVEFANIFKNIVASPRPPGLVIPVEGFSYPSGHSALAATFWIFITLLSSKFYSRDGFKIQVTLSAIIIPMVLFSRLYLGAHWVSDVLGGVALGIGVACIVIFSLRHFVAKDFPYKESIIVLFTCYMLSYALMMQHHFTKERHGYQFKKITSSLDERVWWDRDGTPQPLYRLTRTGKPIELMNVQWNGALDQIQKELLAQGWQEIPNESLMVTLTHITNLTQQQLVPFIKQLYLDKPPKLTLIKPITSRYHKTYWLILRLWGSNIVLQESNYPLWVGTINFADGSHPNYLAKRIHHDENGMPTDTSAAKLLTADLSHFSWKSLSVQKRWNLPETEYGHRYLLLVKDHATTEVQ